MAANEHRQYWLATLDKIARPVLSALAAGKLRAGMPVETHDGRQTNLPNSTYLEALGRLLTGIAPWLESSSGNDAEITLRDTYRTITRQALASGFDPDSPDYLYSHMVHQHLVDTAFLAHAIVRAPEQLWAQLPAQTQNQLAAALIMTRKIRPSFNNWLLFSAMVEAALHRMGREHDPMRVDYAVRQHMQWYCGDGMYNDGPCYHNDNYNSYVIQPMLTDIVATLPDCCSAEDRAAIEKRAIRYAAVQERLIMPDGSFPAIGRSICYRTGAFHHLAHMALNHKLPDDMPPAQVRCALTSVMRRTLEAPNTFGPEGYLTIGLTGHQPAQAEPYISTGSLYLCAASLLPLGLPADDPFWSAPDQPWTQARIWAGENIPADHAMHE